ncbi:MAG: Gldg family protein [Thiohalomonadales bacterium]
MNNLKHIKLISTGGIALAVVLLIAVNILSSAIFKTSRLDLTDNKLYTLSQGTKNILASLEEPVTLRFYFSEKLTSGIPSLSNYARQVRELLEEYANLSKGNVKLIVSDPEPFSDAEDQAVQNGLQGVPIDAAGSVAYFGLVGTSATDDKEVIPFFQAEKEATLEYELTRLVYKLSDPKKAVVGLITALPMSGSGPANPMSAMQAPTPEWMMLSQIKQMFDLRELAIDVDKIPADIDVLMLAHPKGLGVKTLYAIDQFVLGGGRALVFVDPHAEGELVVRDPSNPMAGFGPKNSDLKSLFAAWGVELVNGQLAADIDSAARVSISQGTRPQAVDYVVWLQLSEKNFDPSDFVSSDLKQIAMASSGYFTVKEGVGTTVTPLIQTSSKAMSVPVSKIQFQPNPMGLLDSYQPGGKRLMLAARISGVVKTAFPDGAPSDDKKDSEKSAIVVGDNPHAPKKESSEADKVADDKKPTGLMESKEPINVIVVADSDMLDDKFWVNVQNFFGQRVAVPRNNNGVFVANAIDNLTGSNDLIGLRSRGNFSRPFEKVKDIQRDAEKKFRAREKELQETLRATEQKITDLQRQKGESGSTILSSAQRNEIEKFRKEQSRTRMSLRNVQHELRKDIEYLGSVLKVLNIVLIPILIILFAIGLSVYRHKKIAKLAAD